MPALFDVGLLGALPAFRHLFQPILRGRFCVPKPLPPGLGLRAAGVENAASREGKSLAEWLRELARRPARERPADPIELLLAEMMATRYALLNLFHATALAGAEGKQLLPDSVLKIRDQADAQKRQKARKLLQDFFAQAEDPGSRKA